MTANAADAADNHPRGLLLMAVSVFTGSMMRVATHAAVSLGGLRVESLLLLWGASSLVLAAASIFALHGWHAVKPASAAVARILALRGALGAAALYLLQTAYRRLPVGPVTSLFFVNPVFTMLLGRTLLAERTARGELAGAALSLAGIALVARPWTWQAAHSDPLGIAAALAAAALAACAYTALRAGTQRGAHHMAFVVAYSAAVGLTGLACGGARALAVDRRTLLTAAAGCAAGFVSNAALSLGFKHIRAGTGALLRKADVAVTFALAYVALGELPKLFEVLGATLIVAGTTIVALVAFEKRNASPPLPR